MEPIRQAISRGASISLLFGLDFALSEPEAVRTLVALGVDTRCYSSCDTFHPKGYIFRTGGSVRAVVGSSNLSGSGLTSGREWNVAIERESSVGPARFYFKINKSFKTYGQLTVPRSQVSYSRLEGEGFRNGNLTIAFEEERELRGFMHSATAGFGPYYQIRMPINGVHPLFLLPIGTRVSVALERSNDGDRVVRIARSFNLDHDSPSNGLQPTASIAL